MIEFEEVAGVEWPEGRHGGHGRATDQSTGRLNGLMLNVHSRCAAYCRHQMMRVL